MGVGALKSRLRPLLLEAYRRSGARELRWWAHQRSKVLREVTSLVRRNHWREIHTRDSCVYGASLAPFLVDLAGRMVGLRRCDGRAVEHLESALASILGVSSVVTFRSGRNSLRAILQAMAIGEGDEVILPGFTCVVVPYTILQCGAVPVYVDIRSDYMMNPAALRASLTERTRAIIAQHIFGLPDRMSEIMALASERGIRVIEDCTHVLPGSAHGGKALGTWGDAAYFSFERAKTLSSWWGGAAVTRDPDIGRRLRQIRQVVPLVSRSENLRIGVRLLLGILTHHPSLFAVSGLLRRPLERRGVFPDPVPPGELRGDPPDQLLGRLADSQADLLLGQVRRLPSISAHRRSCVRALSERLGGSPIDLPLMWYPFQVANSEEALEHYASHQIELRRWRAPLIPRDCDTARARYRWGSCPVAEEISRGCVALPTMLERADLERVIRVSLCRDMRVKEAS